METLRKYVNMTFLLISIAAIVPVYANLETAIEPKKTEAVKWHKRPEVREKAKKVFEAVFGVGYGIGTLALMYYVVIPALVKSRAQSCTICKDNEFHREIAKICTKYGVEKYHLLF